MSNIPSVTIAQLLDAGVHFGHKKSRWNPKMAPYIYGIREDVHIVDLQQTLGLLKRALKKIEDVVKSNGKVLFVGTKIQASPIVAEFAEKCGQYYVNHRWLGGMLTNWNTASRSIKSLESIEKILQDEEKSSGYTKKELLDMSRKCEKLTRFLGGIRNMGGKPDILFVIDTNKEHIAIKEAKKLGIPIIGIVDTNSDPDDVDFPIPGNDDAIRSIRLYCSLVADASLSGIEEALKESGVDIGSLESGEEKFKAAKKVTKLKSSKKVVTQGANKDDNESGEFEEALEKSFEKSSDDN